MIIIGLLLLVAAAVFGLDLIWKNHYTIRSPARPYSGRRWASTTPPGSSSPALSPARSCSWGSP